jgi:hypothetical protein
MPLGRSPVAGGARRTPGSRQPNGIQSTPSFVIGRLVDGQFLGQHTHAGVKPFEYFAATIDALLVQ